MVLNSLPSDLNAFVQSKVTTGEFATPDDVVCHALRLLQDREEKLKALRAEIQIGIDEVERGEFSPFNIEATKARFLARFAAANQSDARTND